MNPLSKIGATIVPDGAAASVEDVAALLLEWRA